MSKKRCKLLEKEKNITRNKMLNIWDYVEELQFKNMKLGDKCVPQFLNINRLLKEINYSINEASGALDYLDIHGCTFSKPKNKEADLKKKLLFSGDFHYYKKNIHYRIEELWIMLAKVYGEYFKIDVEKRNYYDLFDKRKEFLEKINDLELREIFKEHAQEVVPCLQIYKAENSKIFSDKEDDLINITENYIRLYSVILKIFNFIDNTYDSR